MAGAALRPEISHLLQLLHLLAQRLDFLVRLHVEQLKARCLVSPVIDLLLGVVGLVPFAGLLAVFAFLSGAGGTCAGDGAACEVSTFVRYGGLAVVLGCCLVAALTARTVARGARP